MEPWSEAADAAASVASLAGPVDLLVVDHYGLGATWETAMRPRARAILAVDDLADRTHHVDAVLDQSDVRRRPERYDGLVPPACVRLVGPEFALLRPEFFDSRLWRPRAGVWQRLLIFFGGADVGNDSEKALIAARQSKPEGSITVILGSAARSADRMRARCRELDAELAIDVEDIAARMSAADLALGSCGVVALERCAVGLPTVAVVAAENQRSLSEALAERGAIRLLGWHADVDVARWRDALGAMDADPDSLARMSRACEGLVGDGVARVQAWLMGRVAA